MTREQLHTFLEKYSNGTYTETEHLAFRTWLYTAPEKEVEAIIEAYPDLKRSGIYLAKDHTALIDRIEARLDEYDHTISIAATLPTAKPKQIFFRNWWAVAALFILLLGSGVYYFNHQSYQSHKSNESQFRQKTQASIPPGTNKAILTLSNGTQKELSLAENGLQLQSDAVLLTTPRGGQYQAVLPDGSKVWLNAASSIKFPSAFTAKERRVEVTGEVYFEIAKDASKPFKVFGGGQEIEVLGTSFNINIYDDEPTRKTTLITGSIKVINNNQTAILKPGQQASIPILSIPKIRLIQVQTNEVIAWKEGLFHFEGSTLPEIMRQLERWYNITVQYQGAIPDIVIKGEVYRSLQLADVLYVLQKMGLQFEMNDRTLIVKPVSAKSVK